MATIKSPMPDAANLRFARHLDCCAAAPEQPTCPECGKPLKAKKSWGGLMACYCKWGGRKPSTNQIIEDAENAERHNAPDEPHRPGERRDEH